MFAKRATETAVPSVPEAEGLVEIRALWSPAVWFTEYRLVAIRAAEAGLNGLTRPDGRACHRGVRGREPRYELYWCFEPERLRATAVAKAGSSASREYRSGRSRTQVKVLAMAQTLLAVPATKRNTMLSYASLSDTAPS